MIQDVETLVFPKEIHKTDITDRSKKQYFNFQANCSMAKQFALFVQLFCIFEAVEVGQCSLNLGCVCWPIACDLNNYIVTC